MPSSVLHDQIPHSLLFPDPPLYFLPPRVFCCTCFVHILTPDRTNFLPKPQNASSWDIPDFKRVIVVILETHRYFLSADVTFFEDSPFFSTSESLPVSEVLPLPIISPPDAVPSRPLQVYHRRHRVVVPPSLAEVPVTHFLSLRLLLPRLYLLLLTYHCSSKGNRLLTMVDEMAALHSNDTWDLVVLPSGKSIVGCRWVYTVKVDPDGQIALFVYCSPWLLCVLGLFIRGVWFSVQVTRSLYGLKQSLLEHVYVDDIVITGSDQNGIQKLKQHIFTHFKTKDLGKLKYFLGIEIAQSSFGVVLSQRKYALDILEETGMLDCKLVDTPMDPNVKLIPGQGEPLRDPGRYRLLVGQGVLYKNRGHTQIVGYTDADWAGSPQIDVPLPGIVFLLEVT
ncbi:Retrovirus-related Pol polyprotein from transposon RE1 [Vitis vinifera]|uniref:Retrovirus-related Pol polyprotein from transposon RE1 n=1 Tax=Vitis vinifera TaxID=29760 RepID=A0A438EM19_VITVI|nr:Retrovirus-related Pol polyprotein from transposon RE1 [Vitis vinifera]